jgi:hypothetical protein
MIIQHIGHFTTYGAARAIVLQRPSNSYTVKHLVMKKQMMVTLILGLLLQAGSFAQNKHRASSDYVSDKGWWMIESNIHTPKKNIVYFYNNDGVLVYKENIEGLRINPSRKSTRIQLKKALETAVMAWEEKRQVTENGLVVNSLRKK